LDLNRFIWDDFRFKDLILKPSLNIYNNLAEVENIRGRLSVELEIFPNPLISWEFECLDETELRDLKPDELDTIFFKKPLNNIDANKLRIIKPYSRSLSTWLDVSDRYCAVRVKGYSREFCIGDLNADINALTFYWPNFRLHAICEAHNIPHDDSRWKHAHKDMFMVEEPFLDNWMISISTRDSSFQWLNPIARNTGIMLTTIGKIHGNGKNDLRTIKFVDIKKTIGQLSLLISFANGGYTYPILYEGHRLPPEDGRSSMVFKHFDAKRQITPLEQFSNTWFVRESDLGKLIRCNRNFSSALDNQSWYDSYLFILTNYLLATSTNSWQIAASSIGAVLERLSYLLLVEDENDMKEKANNICLFKPGMRPQSEEIIKRILTKIGLTKDRKINDIDHVASFISVRNDAVHPINKKMSVEERWKCIRYGVQWAEEGILWRLGYAGWYRDRISSSKEENKEYAANPGVFVPRYFVQNMG